MFITYFIILILSILVRLMHWPGGDLLLLISPVFPLIDILVQIIRRKKREQPALRILGSVTLFGISVFVLFRLLFWNGGFLMFFFFLATLLPFLIVFILRKPNMQKRFVTIFAMSVLTIGLHFTNAYQIYEIYTVKNPFHAKDERIPEFALFKLAWFYHLAGKNDAARKTIRQTIDQVNQDCNSSDFYYEENARKYYCADRLEILQQQLRALENGQPMNYFVINNML